MQHVGIGQHQIRFGTNPATLRGRRIAVIHAGTKRGADGGFVTQGGGSATGGWAPPLRSEDAPVPYARGAVGLALGGRDTGRSQFFVTHAPQPHLTGEYPLFGRVLEGQRVIERIQPGDRMRLMLDPTVR